MKYYEINEETARRAHDMMSMSDYKRGSQTAEYRQEVDRAAALVEKKKTQVSEFYHEKLDNLLDSYARALALYYNRENEIGTRCLSVMVAGPANFPIRKKEKQVAAWEANRENYEKAKRILQKISGVGTGAIDFADPHAREMLVERVESAKALHESHLAANRYYRKYKTLEGCPGVSDKDREWLTRPGVFARGDGSPLDLYGVPFPPYSLQSETAAIKRYTERLEKYDMMQQQASESKGTEKFSGGEIIRNAELNRLQIIFDGKPDEETRSALKSNGFRWSPKNGAWQRQLTKNAEAAARVALSL